MHRRVFAQFLLATCCFGLNLGGHAEAAKGWFGFTVNVDVDGIFNPVLRSATLLSVSPDSPAAKQGLAAGDQIIGVEGIAIAGRPAKQVQALFQKTVGETLRLQLKRANGDSYSVQLIAAAQPATH